MIKLAFFFVLLIVAHAGYLAPVVNTGASTQYRQQDNIGNYAFAYNEGHSSGGTFRKESGDAWGNKVGSYGLRDADGRLRIVNYIADGHGFRATIQTNEPGTISSHPAATLINTPSIQAVPAAKLLTSAAYAPPFYRPNDYTPSANGHHKYARGPYHQDGYSYGVPY